MSFTLHVNAIAQKTFPGRICEDLVPWLPGIANGRSDKVSAPIWGIAVGKDQAAADREASSATATCSGGSAGLPRVMSAAFSAIMIVGALVLPDTRSGITEAST